MQSSTGGQRAAVARSAQPVLDELDRRIIAELMVQGRLPNNLLAERVGVAASTALLRTRKLEESGVITGYRAVVDASALGLDLQALVSVRIRPGARAELPTMFAHLTQQPGVQSVAFVSGDFDFVLHIDAANTGALRDFVTGVLSSDPRVESTHTALIFQHALGTQPFPSGAA